MTIAATIAVTGRINVREIGERASRHRDISGRMVVGSATRLVAIVFTG